MRLVARTEKGSRVSLQGKVYTPNFLGKGNYPVNKHGNTKLQSQRCSKNFE